jgi:carbon monoxide dehydrogenase subunit G
VELNNEFEVDRPIDETWVVLTDVERIAPCLPGAQLQEVEGDEYRGIVKVKVGPITAQYKGKATFVEKDDDAHKAVLKAEGRDSRGQGNASALITAQLTEVGGNRTRVTVNTDLTVTGKVAQFGRGVMGEVSEKLLGQFVQNLETSVLSQPSEVGAAARSVAGAAEPPAAGGAPASSTSATADEETQASNGSGPAPTPTVAPPDTAASVPNADVAPASAGVRRIESAEPEPVDLLDATGASLAKRLAPVLGVVAVLFVLFRLRSRRRRRRAFPASLLDQGSTLLDQGSTLVAQGLSEGSALLSKGIDEGTALLSEGAAKVRRGRRR